ncbi:hypothetical protein HanXRQr2_Chr16g0736961 [Helianthus annuus]|uniref:Uncharacterized protein n=1 Tax=Helianthus annuus TaxID=4232 RepID=A0A9K3DP45_HELAN|nr:hypothetical protein HanXRQr2_Chr16g0736961 [Helianthus annuus]KAJ0437326.1 hypothetical protein HanHA300_Chr16g0600811 [Helianthus annuus]KAJ0459641.1 hypothetical protein HanHA89_Chr16g0651311 [Helianthus annuus]
MVVAAHDGGDRGRERVRDRESEERERERERERENRRSKARTVGRSIYPMMVVSDGGQTADPSDRRPEAPETAVVLAIVWFEFWFRRVHISSCRVWVQFNKFEFR